MTHTTNPTVQQVRAFLASNGWSDLESAEFILAYPQHRGQGSSTTISHDEWTFLAMGHEVEPFIVDKRIWSATKSWFNSLHPSVQWGDLSEPERLGAREAFLDQLGE